MMIAAILRSRSGLSWSRIFSRKKSSIPIPLPVPESRYDKPEHSDEIFEVFKKGYGVLKGCKPRYRRQFNNKHLDNLFESKDYLKIIGHFKGILAYDNKVEAIVTEKTLEIVMKTCSEMNRTQDALAVIGFGIKRKLNFNHFGVGPVLEKLVEQGKFDICLGLIKWFVSNKCCSGERILYNIHLNGLYVSGRINEAKTFFDIMVQNGKADMNSHGLVINHLWKNNLSKDAEKMVGQLNLRKMLIESPFDFRVLLKKLLQPDTPNGKKKFKSLVFDDKNIILKPWLFNILANHFCNMLESGKVECVVQMMYKRGIHPDNETMEIWLKSYCVSGNTEQAKKFYESMTNKDIVSFHTVYEALLEKGELDQALMFLDARKKLAPEDSELSYSKAVARVRELELCKAIESYNRYLEAEKKVDPKDSELSHSKAVFRTQELELPKTTESSNRKTGPMDMHPNFSEDNDDQNMQ